MAIFKCHLTRMVEETATIEVVAADEYEARELAYAQRRDDAVKWEPGDDMTSCRVYSVMNEAGEQVWEG